MNRPFRLKDKVTGLYYIPVRRVKMAGVKGYRSIKSNLSKFGKIYFTDPRRHIGKRIVTHLHFDTINRGTWIDYKNVPYIPIWEVEYLTPVNPINSNHDAELYYREELARREEIDRLNGHEHMGG